jgi:hypothetical protein
MNDSAHLIQVNPGLAASGAGGGGSASLGTSLLEKLPAADIIWER